jgi:hypothetical protein
MKVCGFLENSGSSEGGVPSFLDGKIVQAVKSAAIPIAYELLISEG